jgi:DNA repair protein RadC
MESITSPSQAALSAQKLIGDNAYETFLVTYQNAQNCIFAYEEFTQGSMTGVGIVPGSVIRSALLSGAVSLITYHQHPSGSLQPSAEDRQLWSKLGEMATMMDIKVLDNFILTSEGYFSETEGSPSGW